MKLTRVQELLHELMEADIPISNTSRGEQIHQTRRNEITKRLKEALFEDCLVSFSNETEEGIVPYLTKDGVILELPNASIADGITNDFGSGAISIEMRFTIKSLEYNAADESEDYDLKEIQKQKDKEDREKKKADKIARDRKAREARELKRAKMLEAAARFTEED